jgi:hypothetical protein
LFNSPPRAVAVCSAVNVLRAAIHASKSVTQNYSIALFIAQSIANVHGKGVRILVLDVAETPALIDVL